MKHVVRLTLIALAIMIVRFAPALAQTDAMKGEASEVEWQTGLFAPDATGSQSKAREFDGRNFQNVWGIERLNWYGYNGPYQYWLNAGDLSLGDSSVGFDLNFENDLDLNLSTNALTHNLSRAPYMPVIVNGLGYGINPALSNVIFTPATGPALPLSGVDSAGMPIGDAFRDLTPNAQFQLNRVEDNLGLRHFLGSEGRVALRADLWKATTNGTRQQLFYDSPASISASSQRAGTTMDVNRSTGISDLGLDLQIGEGSVINYTAESTYFTDHSTFENPLSAANKVLNEIQIPSVDTTSNILKARSRLTEKLFFTGVYTARDRSNKTATADVLNFKLPAGTVIPLNNRIRTSSTNMALTFLATDSLSFTGRYRNYVLDNLVPGDFLNGTTVTSLGNSALSRTVSSAEIGASYTGLKYAYLRLGFEHQTTDREENQLLGGGPPATDVVNQSPSSNTDIWRVSARYYPDLSLSLAGSLETRKTDHPAFNGTPTDSTRTNLNATYMLRDNFALYGDYSAWDDKNNEARVDLATAFAGGVWQNSTLPILAAGQTFTNNMANTNVGAWYGLTPKLTLDANVARINTDASALLIIGNSTTTAANNLPPDLVPYTAESNEWSTGLTYALKPSWQIYGRFLNSDSKGHSVLNSVASIPPGITLPDGWTPIDVNEKRYTIGFAFDLAAKSRVLLDYSISDWTDNIVTDETGRFSTWRIAWESPF